MDNLTNKFIVIDGLDGSGKTTQIKLLSDYLEAHNIPYVALRDPGSTILGNSLRKLLLDNTEEEIDAHAEMLMFSAARRQLFARKIAPALQEGKTVICDRYIGSTLAYQSVNGSTEHSILSAYLNSVGERRPDHYIILRIPLATALNRIKQRGAQDRIERKGEPYLSRVLDKFENIGEHLDTFSMVDVEGKSEMDVHDNIISVLQGFVECWS